MSLIFVYGSLKAGFQNAHVNQDAQQLGAFRTRERFPLLLLGDGHVPCIVQQPGSGHQVVGELYEAGPEALAQMDKLERLDEPRGYRRVSIEVESMAADASAVLMVQVYVKPPEHVSAGEQRAGPLAEYTAEYAERFKW